MRSGIYLDTSAWFGVLSERAPQHGRLRGAYHELIRRGERLVTTNLVVAEMHGLLLRRLGRDVALDYLDTLSTEATHHVRFIDRQLATAAIDRWLRPFRDQRFSLVDAVSFELMRLEGIRTAFALDRHFAAAGFQMMPDSQ